MLFSSVALRRFGTDVGARSSSSLLRSGSSRSLALMPSLAGVRAATNGSSSSFNSPSSIHRVHTYGSTTKASLSTDTTGESTMDTMESGTKMYMSLYPEGSTDGSLRLGNIVPDFSAETTHGDMESFHEWKKDKWAILFSHPADFTRE